MPSGPRVHYASPFVPPEWIAAHGLRPGRLVPEGLIEGPLVRPQEGLCPFAQSVANTATQDSQAVGTIFTTTCDQMRRIFEEFAATTAPGFLLNVSVNPSQPASRELYRYELLRLGRWLCDLGGQTPSSEKLAETIRRYARKRNQLSAPDPNLSARAGAQHWLDFHTDPDSSILQPLAPISQPPSPNPHPPTAIPLALLGGPLSRAELWLYDFLEECGARITWDATEFGTRCQPASFDSDLLTQDPLAALVQAYATIPDLFQRPNDAFYTWLDGQLTLRPVRGLVILRWLWCDLWAAESARLMERYRLPTAVIELTGHDRARGPIQTRLAALVESLK